MITKKGFVLAEFIGFSREMVRDKIPKIIEGANLPLPPSIIYNPNTILIPTDQDQNPLPVIRLSGTGTMDSHNLMIALYKAGIVARYDCDGNFYTINDIEEELREEGEDRH